jgi:hypothetical protein
MNDNQIYELEQTLERLLENFEPVDYEAGSYLIYNVNDDPIVVGDDLADAIDHAREVLYGDALDQDD